MHSATTDRPTWQPEIEWLRALAHRLARDDAQAEDAVQDTLLAAVSERPAGDPPTRSWLATVLRNAIRDQRRRSVVRRRALAGAVAGAEPSTLDVVERLVMRRRLSAAVASLRAPHREAIEQRYLEGLPPAAIAARANRPVDTVRTHLQRGIAELRRKLDVRRAGFAATWFPRAVAVGLAGAAATLVLVAALWMFTARPARVDVSHLGLVWTPGQAPRELVESNPALADLLADHELDQSNLVIECDRDGRVLRIGGS